MPARSGARWGWYRLADDVARTLVASGGLRSGDLVLDLGAGDGAITKQLVGMDVRVVAFELHRSRAATLAERFAGVPSVKVVRADITDLRLPRRRFHVIANPPFDCASPVLAQLTSPRSSMAGASLVLPTAVARRWQQRLAMRPGPWTMSVVSRIPRSAFTPRPHVDCCIVRLDRRARPSPRRRPLSPRRATS